ncbi:MAG: hypothetical protein ACYC9L_00215 [Sulfuricaulis sp.]
MKFYPRWGATALFVAVLGASSVSNAALVSRLGGLAYYDTVLNITWLADANAAVGSTYDTYMPGTGLMTWSQANTWAAGLTVDGVTGWRLPTVNPVNGSSFNPGWSYNGSTDYGFNVSAPGTIYAGSTGSEMAYLFYNTLGNKADCSTAGICPQPGGGLTNTGPFSNVQFGYWSASLYGSGYAWDFNFNDNGPSDQPGSFNAGEQAVSNEAYPNLPAWAVHSGDVGMSTVPVPAAVWLFGSGLLGLIGVTRRYAA